jgi:hypothetical protein
VVVGGGGTTYSIVIVNTWRPRHNREGDGSGWPAGALVCTAESVLSAATPFRRHNINIYCDSSIRQTQPCFGGLGLNV